MDNARGDVPREWYRDEGHVGYDVDGRKIVKQKWDDSIEHLIRLTDDLSYWRNVFDEKGGKELVVSKSQESVLAHFFMNCLNMYCLLRGSCL
jgi:ribosome biogenesis protein ERB1